MDALFRLGKYNNNREKQNDTLQFIQNKNKYSLTLPKTSDTCQLDKIKCYDCSDDFKIKKIVLLIGNTIVQSIECTDFLNYTNFYTKNNDVYYYDLKKTNLFFEIKLLCIKYSDVVITLETVGNCSNIYLVVDSYYYNVEPRKYLASNNHKDYIYNLTLSKTLNDIYDHNENYNLFIKGKLNGMIIKVYDHFYDIIKNCSIKFFNTNMIYYKSGSDFLEKIQILSMDTIYIPFNENKITEFNSNSVDTLKYDVYIKFEFRDEKSHKIKIGGYTYNEFITYTDMKIGQLEYCYKETFNINQSHL
jgi:hypothetical protein